ncbi:MAG: hypothetical protein ABI836_05860, partial [Gemmatimonadota bacterium]
MKRLGSLLAAAAVILAACTDSGPTGSGPEADAGSVVRGTPPNPCTDCVYGPTTFSANNTDLRFTATPGDCTFNIEDDGNPATEARVTLNGIDIVGSSDLVGTPSSMTV